MSFHSHRDSAIGISRPKLQLHNKLVKNKVQSVREPTEGVEWDYRKLKS